MTTPPDITTGSFAGVPFPPDVQAQIINLLITGSPFANSLTRQPTVRSSIAWPTAKPTGFAWLDELQPFPVVEMADDAYVVAIAEIGGIVDVSNESVSDSAINLSNSLGVVLKDSLSRDLDLGLLHGSGPPEPVGVIGVAPAATGADLLAQVTAAKGSIGDAGGTANTLAISATALAAEDAKTGTTGELVYDSGFAAAVGLTAVVVPALTPPLVYDAARCYLALRTPDTQVETRDWHFDRDATSVQAQRRRAGPLALGLSHC